jgi:hypothetical protein
MVSAVSKEAHCKPQFNNASFCEMFVCLRHGHLVHDFCWSYKRLLTGAGARYNK